MQLNKYILPATFACMVTMTAFTIYRSNFVNLMIDTSLIPTVQDTEQLPFKVDTYDTLKEQESEENTGNSVDYNKLYYYQRIAYAKLLDEQLSKRQKADDTDNEGIPIQVDEHDKQASVKQQQTNTVPQQAQQQTTPYLKAAQTNLSIDTEQYDYLIDQAETWLGIPYVWGGNSRNGTDCSGFVQQLYRSLGVSLPRTSAEQSKQGLLVPRNELLPGDLLFFDTHSARDYSDITTPTQEMINAKQVEDGYKPNEVSHVGMYVGNGKMIHAASGSGYIKYENIETKYYKTRFLNARRILIPQMKER